MSAVRLEEKVGTIVSLMERTSKVSGHARFSLPQLPERIEDAPTIDGIAQSLGLDVTQIGNGKLQPAVYSAGVPFVLVPVGDKEALTSIQLERRGWSEIYKGASKNVYAFTPSDGNHLVQFAAHSFVGTSQLKEDPATGSAAAALCGMLADNYYEGDGLVDFIIEQGVEMGRPSQIEAQIKQEDGVLTHAGIGGHAIVLVEGQLFTDDE